MSFCILYPLAYPQSPSYWLHHQHAFLLLLAVSLFCFWPLLRKNDQDQAYFYTKNNFHSDILIFFRCNHYTPLYCKYFPEWPVFLADPKWKSILEQFYEGHKLACIQRDPLF